MPVDQMFVNLAVGRSKLDPIDRLKRHLQSSCCEVCMPRGQRGIDIGIGADRGDLEFDPEFVREPAREFVLGTFRHVVRAAIKSERTGTRDDT